MRLPVYRWVLIRSDPPARRSGVSVDPAGRHARRHRSGQVALSSRGSSFLHLRDFQVVLHLFCFFFEYIHLNGSSAAGGSKRYHPRPQIRNCSISGICRRVLNSSMIEVLVIGGDLQVVLGSVCKMPLFGPGHAVRRSLPIVFKTTYFLSIPYSFHFLFYFLICFFWFHRLFRAVFIDANMVKRASQSVKNFSVQACFENSSPSN